uniref:Uncharacterized protein n=1 Tax=Arundo donax TaxID=35708 RepID=A0A0A9ATF2_ARUDO
MDYTELCSGSEPFPRRAETMNIYHLG